ncbi:MAG: hypothetical protein FJ102_14115 [Deltaproteobacteria bacterium]|nr:hypothetical protein [Deltaproteobacteria bacterium]
MPLLALLGACATGFSDPSRELAPAVAAGEPHADEIHVPSDLGIWNTPLKDDPELPQAAACETCHGPDAPRSGPPRDDFHDAIELEHGTLNCNQCHDADRTRLRLADATTLPFTEVMSLCRQCHGPQSRDYQHWSHGGNTGYWDERQGAAVRNNCVDCHDPHAPAFPLVRPVFPPRDRGYVEPELHE